MLRCPFCHYDNEDGALFCEQCKSDLAGVEQPVVANPVEAAVPLAAPYVETIPVVEAAVIAEAVPVEAMPVEAVPVPVEEVASPMAETIPAAEPIPEAPEVHAAPPPAAEAAPPPPPPAPPAPPPPAPAAAVPPPAPAAPPPAPAVPPPAPAAPAADAGLIPASAQPRLLVLRGQKRQVEYPLYEGQNFIGRADEKPVDIDLEDQEPPDRIWSSRQHAVITFENGRMTIEDLNSSNGTFVNRAKIYPAQPQPLKVNDVIQIGTVQLKLIV
jgi:hypothetical protein